MKKRYPSPHGDRGKIGDLILLLAALALLLLAPKDLIAEPSHPTKDGVYWMASLLDEEAQIKHEIRRTWRGDRVTAIAVARAEGGLDPDAIGDLNNRLAPEGSHCFYQINKTAHKSKFEGRDINNWRDCIEVAKEVYDEAGGKWTPWSAFNNGSYKNHIQ